MMRIKGALGTLIAVVLVLGLGTHAEAQLAKQGTFSGWFGWSSTGTTQQLGENHVFWVGEFNGAMRNDAGKGLMHHTALVCPGSWDINQGISTAQGTCVVTDRDGDNMFVKWQCTGTYPECLGESELTGGTGKYTGIRGKSRLIGSGTISTTPQGYALLTEGEYTLP